MLVEVGGKLSFATEDPWQGAACLLCAATPSSGARVVGTIPDKTSGELHARARSEIDSGGQVSASAFATLLAVHATINDKISFDLKADDLVSLVTPSGVAQSSQAVHRDRWFCAELSALVSSSSSGWARLSIDGAIVAEISGVPTLRQKQADGELWAGIEWSSEGSASLAVQIDDLEYSELPLPCP